MRINFKLRFMNPTTLIPIIIQSVFLIYTLLGFFGITPSITQDEFKDFLLGIVQFLILVGIFNDPTTEGIHDSDRAMEYTEPNRYRDTSKF